MSRLRLEFWKPQCWDWDWNRKSFNIETGTENQNGCYLFKTETETRISLCVNGRVRPIPGMSRYTDTQYRYKAVSKNRYWYVGYGGYWYRYIGMIPIPIFPISPILNRYRFIQIFCHTVTDSWRLLHTDTNTDSYRFIPILFKQIPILGIGISAHTGYLSKSTSRVG